MHLQNSNTSITTRVPWSLVRCTLVAWNLVACYFGCACTSFDCLVAWTLITSLLFSSQMSCWSCHLCLVALAIWTFLICSFQWEIQIWSQIGSSCSSSRVISFQSFSWFVVYNHPQKLSSIVRLEYFRNYCTVNMQLSSYSSDRQHVRTQYGDPHIIISIWSYHLVFI